MLTLQREGHHAEFWWAPGHADIEGNETADTVARGAALGTCMQTESFSVSRSMLEHHLHRWYHTQAQAQLQTTRDMGAGLAGDPIISTDLRWTRLMPSRFMAARVGQFLTGHFPTGEYLFRFGSPLRHFLSVVPFEIVMSICLWSAPGGAIIDNISRAGYRRRRERLPWRARSLQHGLGISLWAQRGVDYGWGGSWWG